LKTKDVGVNTDFFLENEQKIILG